jgi:hypothetical protein
MADAKLLTEIVHAMVYGVTTTDARSLRKIYADYDPQFDMDADFARRLKRAFARLSRWGVLPKPLRKPYHGYSLLLALMHLSQPLQSLRPVVPRRDALLGDDAIKANLNRLAIVADMEVEDVPSSFEVFYEASGKGTNVRAAREDRVQWYNRALTDASVAGL